MKQMLFEFGPVQRTSGLKLAGHWVWCGSVIRGEDGRYHMFASCWPDTHAFHPSWLTASKIVRAASATLHGPYKIEEVVLPPRGAEYWDGRMTHNPCITRAGGRYVLYYTGATHPFSDPDPAKRTRKIGD